MDKRNPTMSNMEVAWKRKTRNFACEYPESKEARDGARDGTKKRRYLRHVFAGFKFNMKLGSEKHDVVEDNLAFPKFRLLRELMMMDIATDRQRHVFEQTILDLLHNDPNLAKVLFSVEKSDELLINQVVWKDPSIQLLAYIYSLHPEAIFRKTYDGFTLLHDACWAQASLDVIRFIAERDPASLQARPFPPLFCAVHKDTSFEVLEFLVKANPEALGSSDISHVTPLDMALEKDLPIDVLKLFLDHYPDADLILSEKASCRQLIAKESRLFAVSHKVIRTFDASKMKFTPAGRSTFFRELAKNDALLELELDLTSSAACTGELKSFICENSTLERLTVSGGIVDAQMLLSLVSGLPENKTLKELTILNGLDADGIELVLETVARCPCVETLCLRHTRVPEARWGALAELKTVKKLDLMNCQIGPVLGKPIAELLTTTMRLKELLLGHNNVGDAGTTAIAVALRSNFTLMKLGYEHNELGDVGWESLLDTMTNYNRTLCSVNFSSAEPDYDRFGPQLEYLCDRNDLSRSIRPAIDEVSRMDGACEAGQSSSQRLEAGRV